MSKKDFVSDPEYIDAERFFKKKKYRKKGIGTILLNHIINIFRSKKYNKIFLEVKESNTIAQEFYSSFGFKRTGERKNYYKDENAILMEKGIVS